MPSAGENISGIQSGTDHACVEKLLDVDELVQLVGVNPRLVGNLHDAVGSLEGASFVP